MEVGAMITDFYVGGEEFKRSLDLVRENPMTRRGCA
jgi:hypothetical protein